MQIIERRRNSAGAVDPTVAAVGFATLVGTLKVVENGNFVALGGLLH